MNYNDYNKPETGANGNTNISRTILMLSLFLIVIIGLQLSRMGIFDNSDQVTHRELAPVTTMTSTSVSENTHDMGKLALIYDKTATDRLYILQNFQSLLDKYSLAYDLIYADETVSLDAYDMLIVIVGNFDHSPILQSVFDSVEEGKTAYFPIVPNDSDSYISVSSSLGIIEKSSQAACSSITDVLGIFGESEKVYAFDSPVSLKYRLILRSDCQVLFRDENKNPLLWKKALGEGLLYISNCDYLSAYESRGVISNILYEALKKQTAASFLCPLYGVSTQLLEEFPSAFLIESSEILEEEKLSFDDFVETRFWPLIVQLQKKHGIKTTISYVISYDENTEGPFEMNLFSENSLKTYATEILKNGGEVAFHGYSMRPLGLEGELASLGWFLPWKSEDSIKEAFDMARTPMKKLFTNYTVTTYVPPQGRLSENILAKLSQLCDGLHVIASPCKRLYPDQIVKDFETDEYGYFHYTLMTGPDGAVWNTVNSLEANLAFISPSARSRISLRS